MFITQDRNIFCLDKLPLSYYHYGAFVRNLFSDVFAQGVFVGAMASSLVISLLFCHTNICIRVEFIPFKRSS